jgi:phosphatidylinositol glycan class W
MDLGVGSFVFSQGVVSAIPILKDPAYLTSSPTPKILRTVKKAIPLVLLGFIRVIMVKGVEYPVCVQGHVQK